MIAHRAIAERTRGRRSQEPRVRQLVAESNPVAVDHLLDLAYSPTLNLWVAVGLHNGGQTYIITSPGGGGPWTRRVSPVNRVCHAIVWTGQQFIAVGGAGQTTILKSADGITWTDVSPDALIIDLVGVDHDGAGLVFAVGGVAGGSGPRAYKSDDHGNTWAAVSTAGLPAKSFRSVTFDGTQWICAGDGASTFLVTTPDRANFTDRSAGAPAGAGIRYVASGGGLAVAIGSALGGGTFIVTSRDHGVTWEGPHPNAATSHGMSAFWTGRQWVALAWLGAASGDPSALYTSRDGKVWAELRRHTRQLVGVKQSSAGEFAGELVAVGGSTLGDGNGSAIVRTAARL